MTDDVILSDILDYSDLFRHCLNCENSKVKFLRENKRLSSIIK